MTNQRRRPCYSSFNALAAGPASEHTHYPSPSPRLPTLEACTMATKSTLKKSTKPKAAKAKTAPARAKGTTWTLEEAMRQLESLGNAGVRAQNAKSGPLGSGVGDNQFGVARGD